MLIAYSVIVRITLDEEWRTGLFEEFTAKHTQFISFIKPKAGSIAMAKLNIKETALEFSNNLVEKTGVMTVPSEMFAYNEKYIRIGFGRKNMPEALDKFDEYLSNFNF